MHQTFLGPAADQCGKARLLAGINVFQTCLLTWAAFWHLLNHRLAASALGIDAAVWSAALLAVIVLTFCRIGVPKTRRRAIAAVLGEFALLTIAATVGPFGPTIVAFVVVAIKAGIVLENRDLFWVFPLTIILRGLAGEGHDYLVHHMPTNINAADYFALVPIWRKARIPFLSALILGTMLFRSLLTEQKAKNELADLDRELRQLELKIDRERIARDIHDSLGHSLTSLSIQLDVALHLLAQGKPGAEASIKTAKILNKQCLVDVRKTLRTISDPDLDYAAAVAQLIENCNKQNLCQIKVKIDVGDSPLNQAVSHHLFCILQEGLTNCLRHAGANNVIIEQNIETEALTLKIKDDGQGFEVTKAVEGNGISSMKFRAESLGGTFCLSSEPGHGTEISIFIPLAPGQTKPAQSFKQLEEQRA
ncbi:MAG: sensor histidine kinase [Cyanobacteria bacterium REEB67]|nr:sensor histidine kinase [Cyanobacteria bacterium REEB67]